MRDYQDSVTTGQMHGQTDTGQSDPYVPLCFPGDTKKLYIHVGVFMKHSDIIVKVTNLLIIVP